MACFSGNVLGIQGKEVPTFHEAQHMHAVAIHACAGLALSSCCYVALGDTCKKCQKCVKLGKYLLARLLSLDTCSQRLL